tara:strand:+ start:292 stop:504 length:213 start_codon:yes stop_codon:yes gene_type:complete
MKLESTEIQAPLPAIAKIVITFYVSMALVCAALIGSMTAIHKGWVKVASLEPKSPALKVPQVKMGFPQAK